VFDTYHAAMTSLKRSMVRLIVVLALLVPGGTAGAEPDVTFTGSGWGDGVGLSQYGAKAMGADGATYREILNRYFTGMTVGPPSTVAADTFLVTDPTPLWVGLIQHSDTVSFTIDSGSARLCFDDPDLCIATAAEGETWRFGPDAEGGCAFLRQSHDGAWVVVGAPLRCSASVQAVTSQTTVAIPFKARSYRGGTLRFRGAPTTGRIHTVLEIGVEDYMKGISAVPESWASSTIEAQVVASRSNALWNALDRGAETTFDASRKEECHCNLYDSSPDQVFRGYTGESGHPNWVTAVISTTQQVMGFSGSVALGLFSSSSGGWTESYSDVFGDTAHPYLVSVNDSAAFSDSAANPHAVWGASSDQSVLALTFGFSWVSDVAVTERNDSGSARTVAITGIRSGQPATALVDAVDVRSALSLRSTTFDVTVIPRFGDVPTDHLFAGEVVGLNALGITSGCTSVDFCPDRSVTRAEMAAFLVRALDLPTASGDPFGDDDGHALEAEIASLAASGITSGCSATSFCPGRAVTREEMAAFLVRGFDLAAATGTPFSDVDGNFFEAEIASLAASSITSGCSATSFCPGRAVTRGEMAAFLIRAIDG
jgi:SpoIID/LytB domain protein